MSRPKVILRDQPGYDIAQIARQAAEMMDSLGTDVRGKTVFVKPSFVFPSKSPISMGIVTRPQFVAGVATALREKGAAKVLVGESSVMGPARVTFEAVGVLPMIKGIADPVYLDEVEEVEVAVPDPFVQSSFRVPKIWLDADVYVNLPKIKTNMFSGITLSIKNNLGLLRQYERLVYHDHRLHKKLADLFKIREPDLTIADCIVAGEGQGPIMAEPVPLGLMVGGNNGVAVDVVACHLAEFTTEEVEHLDLLIKAGYGPRNLEDIDIENPQLLARRHKFKRPHTDLLRMSPRIRVFQGEESYCFSGCGGMVRGLIDPYLSQHGPDGVKPMNIVIGRGAKVPDDIDPETTLVLGDCASEHKNRGEFVSGCCPRPLDVGVVIRRHQGMIQILEEEMTPSNMIGIMRAYTRHRLWRVERMIGGKKTQPIENHLSAPRIIRELTLEIKSRFKK